MSLTHANSGSVHCSEFKSITHELVSLKEVVCYKLPRAKPLVSYVHSEKIE